MHFLPELSSDNESSIYRCPNGSEVPFYTDVNYSMNWRLGHDNGTAQTGFKANLAITSNHANETIFFMDGANNRSIVWAAELANSAYVYADDKNLRMARHQDKANIVYLDGHVEGKSGSQLLPMGTLAYTSNLWTP